MKTIIGQTNFITLVLFLILTNNEKLIIYEQIIFFMNKVLCKKNLFYLPLQQKLLIFLIIPSV